MGLSKPDYAKVKTILWDTQYKGEDAQATENLLMQQYIQYLEMADRISERRNTVHAFFLTLNTGILSAYAMYGESREALDAQALDAALVALILLCICWIWLIRSYRTLNRAKFRVVHMIEERLPSRLFDAEWEALGRSKNWFIHAPLTPIETTVPAVFLGIYAYAYLV